MCYTGLGRFENGMGNCEIVFYKEFREQLDIEPCLVCMGYPFDVEECDNKDELFTEDDFDRIADEAREKGLVR